MSTSPDQPDQQSTLSRWLQDNIRTIERHEDFKNCQFGFDMATSTITIEHLIEDYATLLDRISAIAKTFHLMGCRCVLLTRQGRVIHEFDPALICLATQLYQDHKAQSKGQDCHG